jgi:hypothetical protein
MSIKAWLVARSAQGLAYGRQWLRSRIGQDPCAPCALNRVRYHEFCARGVPVGLGEWLLYDVGVTGEGITRVDGDPDGAWEEIQLTLTSAHAARFKTATVAAAAAPLATFTNDDVVVDFAANPFTAGVLSCLPAPTPTACGFTVAGGVLKATAGTFDYAYHVGSAQRDFVVTCKYHAPTSSSLKEVGLAVRWTAPLHAHVLSTFEQTGDPGDTFIAGELFGLGSGNWQMRVVERMSQNTPASDPLYSTVADGLYSDTAPFALTAGTDYWLRLAVGGPVAQLSIYAADPYASDGSLLPGVTPIAQTAWPPVSHTSSTARVMSDHGVAAIGTYGIVNMQGDVDAFVDDLRLRPECMDFNRWLCEAPPAAAQGVELAPSTPGGTVAAIVTLDATLGQIANAYVEARHGGCDEDGDVFARIDVPLVAYGAKLVIDSSRGRVELVDADGSTFDGTALIALDEGRSIQWIEAPKCDSPICVTAGVGSWCGTHEKATIKIDAQERSR